MPQSLIRKFAFVCAPLAVVTLGTIVANAGKSENQSGVLACVNDKWNETEPEKGHKLVDYAGRCILVPDDAAEPKYTEDCVGKYEYMPDGSWKAGGTCVETFKGGDTRTSTWEEGSHLKEYLFKFTGGTGKYQGAKGGGTYSLDELTSTLYGGRYKGNVELP
jgi:hypothetical protein